MVRIINCVFVLLGQVITHFIHTGLLGTSAARHLATNGAGLGRPLSVVLVGPEETGPAVPPSNEGRSIFAAHLDEGRITRVIDPVRVFPCPLLLLPRRSLVLRIRSGPYSLNVRYLDTEILKGKAACPSTTLLDS